MRRNTIIVLFSIIFLGSCASLAGPRAPSWVLTPPSQDGVDTFFTGSASVAGKDLAKATDAATADLVASIMRYIGVKVTVESSATARATLDSYQTDISQTVKSEATNRIAGFKIKDRYTAYDSKTGRMTVYLLAAYRSADLEKEKKRISELFAEKVDAVAKPEAEGRAFLAAGRNWDALGSFVNAALAASGSDIDNAAIKVERNLASARDSLKSLRIQVVAPKSAVYSGAPYPEAFQIRLVSGSTAQPVPGASLLVSYPRRQANRVVQKTVSVTTDAEGLVVYMPPPPDFVGKGRLTVKVDFSAQTALLDGLPQRWAGSGDQLREAFATAAVDVDYTVLSHAKDIPTALAFVDIDETGKLLDDPVSGPALAETLSAAGFALVPITIEPGLLAGGFDEGIRAAAALGASKALRLVYGSTTAVGARKDGAMWIAEARVNAKVVEIASGKLIYTAEKQVSAVGNDEASARRAALREAGANGLGKELLVSLP